VVDDEPALTRYFRQLLTVSGHHVLVATNAEQAYDIVAAASPDLILLDVMMPGTNGFDVCRRLKSDPVTRLIPIVLITALDDTANRVRGLDAGADDFITKPVNAAELQARARSLLRLKRYTDDLDSAESVIVSLALTIEARDRCTDGHCQRLAAYAATVGTELGLGIEDVDALRKGGFLHDIGKVGVPDAVLLKPGPLTAPEVLIMQEHTIIGDRLCGELRSLRRVRPIVRHHHERLDGSGYPDRLAGDAVPLLAQVMAVVDVFDALTTERPYKRALDPAAALRELDAEVRRGWRNPQVVEVLGRLVQQRRLPRFASSSSLASALTVG
jgi:putative two-component system response regulator